MSSDLTADFDDDTPRDSRPQLEGFDVGVELGRGETCTVYLARQLSLNRLVVVRVANNPQYDTFLDHEVQLLMRLRHPHMVQLYDYLHYGFPPRPCMILEFIPGGTLQRHLNAYPQDPRCSARLVAHIARTVHAIHEAGYLYLSVLPRKILLDSGPDVGPIAAPAQLTDADIGIPRLIGLHRATELDRIVEPPRHMFSAIPAYLAPEQARGDWDQIGRHTDVYCLGVLLYDLLVGRSPFAASSVVERLRLLLEAMPRSPRSQHRDIDRGLDALCMKCLAKDPQRRYHTAAELADALMDHTR